MVHMLMYISHTHVLSKQSNPYARRITAAMGAAGGYWGAVTSSVDFCEANYALTSYVAEPANTLSSLIILLQVPSKCTILPQDP